MEEEPELEVAEEAESLNASLADSSSNFGDAKYHDFDDDGAQKISIFSGDSSRFEDGEEPRLKYDKLSSDIKTILDSDTASTLTVHDKFIVLGTSWGRVYLLDALGHILPQSDTEFSKHNHSVAVSQISVDHAGEFVASCSTDGRVILTGLYSSEYNYSMNTGKPIYSVGLDPIFARADSGKRFMTGDDDKVVLYERRGLLNRYKTTILSNGTDVGPIKCIKWRGRFAAWTTPKKVVVYDIVRMERISVITLDPTEFDQCYLTWSDQKNLFVSHSDTLRICAIKKRPDIEVQSQPNSPQCMVEILHCLKFEDLWICGAAPMDKLMVVLAVPKGPNEDISEEENKPQLIVIEPLNHEDFNEISTDYLDVKNYNNDVNFRDFSLQYLLEDKHYFIVSPRDIFFAKPRDEDDHLDWLLDHQEFEKALNYSESHAKRLSRHTVNATGRKYLDHLIENCHFSELGPLYQRIFKSDKRLWESEIGRLIKLRQIDAIALYLPLGPEKSQIKLESYLYEAVLIEVLERNEDLFLKLIRSWPIQIYDLDKIRVATLQQLLGKNRISNQDNPQTKRALATIYSYQKSYDNAMKLYLDLGHKDVFQLIRKHNLFSNVEEKIEQLMDLDTKDALKLFIEHSDRLSPEIIVDKLQSSRRNLYLYLDYLCTKDWETSKKFHAHMVALYADYNREKLLPFLKASDAYPIHEALETCESHVSVQQLVDERIHILARMSNTRRALHLIIDEKYDIHEAVNFCKKYNEEHLWTALIDFSYNKPHFVRVLLDNIGTHVDPRKLIEKMENGLEIDGLRDSLVRIIHDYRLQLSLQEGCKKILVADCFTLLCRQFNNAKKGLDVNSESLCGLCGKPIIKNEPSDLIIFNCKHSFHAHCLPDSEQTRTCPLCNK